MGKKNRVKMALRDRRDIQGGLDQGERVAKIADDIGRSQSTVREEIMRHATEEHPGYKVLEDRNLCIHRGKCKHNNICKKPGPCRTLCKKCALVRCNLVCPDFETAVCPRHQRTPFVCNGCEDLKSRRDCGYPYRFYIAEIADKMAEETRSAARKGLCVEGEDMVRVLEALRYGLSRRQSLDAIYSANPWMGELFSVSTLYRWNSEELLEGITKLDSVEIVSRRTRDKPRKGEYAKSCIAKEDLEGRRYEDFIALPLEKRANAVQMDTVLGRKEIDTQCILSFQWKDFRFQLYILLPDRTKKSVVAALDMLQEVFGDKYEAWFGVILTDQGAENADVEGIEVNRKTGEHRSSVYFCDPYCSYQKPNAERQHEELRDILPKTITNFDALKPEDAILVTSHVNSYPLRSLERGSAIDRVWPCIGPELEKLGVQRIEPKEVIKSRWLVPHAMVPGTEPGKKPIERSEG
ncbi:MAG: hypothetical protein ACI36W_02840 [Coriobacteriales bacterium]